MEKMKDVSIESKIFEVKENHMQLFQEGLDSGQSVVESLYNSLKSESQLDGAGYALSKDNEFPKEWVLQTPNIWGESAKTAIVGAGKFILECIEDRISNAEELVDISTLTPYPDGAFLTAIQNGLKKIQDSGRKVTVRILCGWYPGAGILGSPNQKVFLQQLIKPLSSSMNNLTIYVGAQQTDPKTWNHSKILAVDGNIGIVGGENMWNDNYLGAEPVHDLNMQIMGSSVFYMHSFLDSIWKEVCSYKKIEWMTECWNGTEGIFKACLPKCGIGLYHGKGSANVLGAGRYGGSKISNNPADIAMGICLNSAKESIYIAQQDLENKIGPKAFYWTVCMTAIAKALLRGVNVYIVISNNKAKATGSTPYSTGTITDTANKIKEFVSKEHGAPTGSKLINLLCSKLNITTLRFGPSDTWKNGYEFANHSKFFMVDEKVFYIGSENLYPSDLLEYGLFIDDIDAIKTIKKSYWDKIWKYSKRVAISGESAKDCYYK